MHNHDEHHHVHSSVADQQQHPQPTASVQQHVATCSPPPQRKRPSEEATTPCQRYEQADAGGASVTGQHRGVKRTKAHLGHDLGQLCVYHLPICCVQQPCGEKCLIRNLTVCSDPCNSWGYCSGNSLWSASELMLRWFSTSNAAKTFDRRHRIIELGCGLGTLGMAAAVYGGSEVLLTDLEAMMPLLRYNIGCNFGPILPSMDTALKAAENPAVGASARLGAGLAPHSSGAAHTPVPEPLVHAEILDWNAPSLPQSCTGPWDLILGADIAYDPRNYRAFWRTLAALSTSQTVVLLALPDRKEDGGLHRTYLFASLARTQKFLCSTDA